MRSIVEVSNCVIVTTYRVRSLILRELKFDLKFLEYFRFLCDRIAISLIVNVIETKLADWDQPLLIDVERSLKYGCNMASSALIR